jgi:protein O-GlcNAc transferase
MKSRLPTGANQDNPHHHKPDGNPESNNASASSRKYRKITLNEGMTLAIGYHQSGRIAQAEQVYRSIIAADPRFAPAHANLGVVLKMQGRVEEAVGSYQQALAINADYPEALSNLGNIHKEQGDLERAVACYTRAVALRPGYVEALCNLGAAQKDQGKFSEAVANLRHALALKPDHAAGYCNLGAALKAQGLLNDAIRSLQRAVRLNSKFAEAYLNLGNALQEKDMLPEARAAYQIALSLKPDYADAAGQLAHVKRALCDWSGLEELYRLVFRAVEQGTAAISPFFFLSVDSTGIQQRRCSNLWVERCFPRPAAPSCARGGSIDRCEQTPIRIGYLSNEFHEHATAYLTAELFELHDRKQFKIYGYSFGPDDGSATRRRLRRAFDCFIDVSQLSVLGTVERIRQDEIDILVDLKGHTRNARTLILKHRAAPIQVNYLGYPGTMGDDFMDYIIVDPFVVPPERAAEYAERLVFLPDCYQPNDSLRPIAANALTRPELGLDPEAFVFCCFCNSYKITPEIFHVWMSLLDTVPSSVMWLLETRVEISDNLRREAAIHGIDPTRIVFAPHCPLPEHLARHRAADLFLDTFPYTAHTTASDALWAGLPVVTCRGDTFASRVASSLLNAVGLPNLVTSSFDEYRSLALHLARDPRGLAAVRSQLAKNRLLMPLFDSPRYVRHLEQAYRTMVEARQAGLDPFSFHVRA